ncbi:hypothetical protein DM01DRAFT_1334934, partial [Hesseltinella vesiculosa]
MLPNSPVRLTKPCQKSNSLLGHDPSKTTTRAENGKQQLVQLFLKENIRIGSS